MTRRAELLSLIGFLFVCRLAIGQEKTGTEPGLAREPFIPIKEQLRTLLGEQIEILADVDGDGVNDLIVPCRLDSTANLDSVYCLSGKDGTTLWTIGRSDGYVSRVSRVADVDEDGVRDLIVVDPGSPMLGITKRKEMIEGALRVYSGRNGALIRRSDGYQLPYLAEIRGVADHDGDGLPDYLLAATRWPHDKAPAYAGSGNRFVLLCSSRNDDILQVYECPDDSWYRMALMAPGDLDGDGREDFLFGSVGGGRSASTYVISSKTGQVLAKVEGVGSALLGLGDVDGDDVPDWAGSSVNISVFDSDWMPAKSTFVSISGATGKRLWEVERPAEESTSYFGMSAASVPDLNHDGVRDVAVGSIDVDFFGKGKQRPVRLFSGSTGELLGEIPTVGGCAAGAALTLIGESADGEFSLALGGAYQDDNPRGATDGFVSAMGLEGQKWIVRAADIVTE